MVGGVVNHNFKFKIPSAGNVGSIKFEYCTTAAGNCAMPEGLVTNNDTSTVQNETGTTGFTLDKTTNGAPYLTRAAANVDAGTSVSYILTDIKNPTTTVKTEMTFFVRIHTYSSSDATGIAIDNGTVAASTSTQIVLTGVMPESLIFCTGKTIDTSNGIPDCSKATDGAVDFNQLFSPTDTATATSQIAASTNATNGYSITVNGHTLESGDNSIAAMSSQITGSRGTGQFGLNLKHNTTATSTTEIGTEVAAAYNGTDLNGQAAAGYNTADNFKFAPSPASEVIASSPMATNPQIFTVSYIVNVPGSQTAGTYTTTLTYVCTAKF